MWTQNDLIHALSRTELIPMPVRIIRVDITKKENLRIEDVQVINGELVIIIDNHLEE